MPARLFRETHYEPIAGRCIMFPSWLMHCVDPNESNDIRISVSFNFLQKTYVCMSFQTNKYQVIKNAVSYDLANFILNYFLLKRDAVSLCMNITYTHSPRYLEHGPINKYLIPTHVMLILLWKLLWLKCYR